jgi:hypothetical protein
MPNHCLFTACSLPIHCLSTPYPEPVHSLLTATRYGSPMFRSRPACPLPIHCLFTAYLLPIYCLFTAYSMQLDVDHPCFNHDLAYSLLIHLLYAQPPTSRTSSALHTTLFTFLPYHHITPFTPNLLHNLLIPSTQCLPKSPQPYNHGHAAASLMPATTMTKLIRPIF